MTTRIAPQLSLSRARRGVAGLAFTAALAACGGGKPAPADSAKTTTDSAAGVVPPDTSHQENPRSVGSPTGPRNTLGRIPVLEYHVIAEKETQFTITREHFMKDL